MRRRQEIPKGLRNRKFKLATRSGEQFKARRVIDRPRGLATYIVDRPGTGIDGNHKEPYVLVIPAEDLEALRALIQAVDVEKDERLEREARRELKEEDES